MKKAVLILICSLYVGILSNQAQAQNIGVNVLNPDPSAIMDITHTSRGLLIPRLPLSSTNDVTTIVSPALSLLIFNTATAGVSPNNVKPGFYYFNGTKWVGIGTGNAWELLGNSGTVAGTNFIGTTDNVDVIFKRNNVQSGLLGSNTSFGVSALNASNTGFGNTAVGANSMSSNTTGFQNTALGTGASAVNTSGYSNTALGFATLQVNTADVNTGIGSYALNLNSTGSSNTATGASALGKNTTASANTANGFFSLEENTTGGSNTAVGSSSLVFNTIGAGNTAIGASTGGTNTIGTNNMFLGYSADATANNLNNATAIGYNAKVGASNTMVLGGTGADVVNVGIGTIVPNSKLEVFDNTGSAEVRISSSTPLKYGELIFSSNNTGFLDRGASIEGNGENTGIDVGAMIFKTQYGAVPRTERLRITSGGNVGINTNTPANKLEITQGTANNSGLRFTNLLNAATLSTNASGDVVATTLNPANALYWGLTGNSGTIAGTNFIGTTDAQDLVTRTNNIERMRVLSGGNVGIGTTTPANLLSNISASSTYANVSSENTGQQGNKSLSWYNDITGFSAAFINTGVLNGANGVQIRTAGNTASQKILALGTGVSSIPNTNTEVMTVLGNGNVGLGTTTPATKLHVLDGQITQEFSTNTSHSILMKNPSGRNWQLYHLSPTDANAPNGFMFEHFDGTSWQRRVTIDQTGNVGIGNTTPLFKLHVQGGRSMFTANSDANVVGVMYAPTTYPFYIGATNVLNTAANTIAGLRSDLVFTEAGGSERMRIVGSNGNVGINTTNPTEKLDIVGSIKIADGSEGAGKVLTSDATGKGTWQSPSALANYPYQTIGTLPVGASCASGGSYFTSTLNLPAGIYNFIHYSCDGQIGAATNGHNVFIDIVSGSGDATSTYHNFINGSVGCGNYFTGVLRCYTPCTVRKEYRSYSGSTFSVPGANSEYTTFIKIL